MQSSKRILTIMLSIALLATGVYTWPETARAAAKAITVTKNNWEPVELNHLPILQNGSALLPLREIGTLLNSKTTWIPEGKRIVITNPETRIELTLGSKQAKVNGKNMAMRTTPYNKNGVVYVPIRFIGEAFGAKVAWHDKERRVNLDLEAKYVYAVQGAAAYWLEKKNGKLYVAENADSVKLISDTKAEVLGYSEFTIDSLSDKVKVLQVYDNYGEPSVHSNTFKMVLVNHKLVLEAKAYNFGHQNRNIARSKGNHALLMNGANLYEVNLDGKLVGEYDLKAITGYEDDNFQVEWYDDHYMVVRPERTGWLTLVDRKTKETTLLAKALLDEEHWKIYQSLDQFSPEFYQWDGLKVIEIKDNKLLLEHYLFLGNKTTEYTFNLASK
ncbi:copper amine oxidase N-terminal domain-containing protein [Paenibacillus paeoniae]|uniref:Copper amine oxidase N-terminal domain-containing protein n=1 Tax=Paenibacillus paeoniae TaxID=2292705 RepID=A0A371P757_9BACL|nr:copper amine oxidase N-terminal domain-containing protein [Paenibacillus paeoniae]REK71296.1 copper amine oxidase N-terminal domain-containing protein [Paenibacillus paeoniae]